MTLGELLRELRGNMSLRTAAEMTHISHTYLDRLEKGEDPRTNKKIYPSVLTLRNIARGYKVPYEALVVMAGYLNPDLDPEKYSTQNVLEDIETIFRTILTEYSEERDIRKLISDLGSVDNVINEFKNASARHKLLMLQRLITPFDGPESSSFLLALLQAQRQRSDDPTSTPITKWEQKMFDEGRMFRFDPDKSRKRIGKTHAGSSIEAIEEISGTIPLPPTIRDKHNDLVWLEVEGDCMDAGTEPIKEGYLVLVKRQPTYEIGDIVVVLVDGGRESMLRIARKRNDGSIWLDAANIENHEPIPVDGSTDVTVFGVVVDVYHNWSGRRKKK